MIKVGYLISYDYQMFFTSVKQLYDYVDKIVLAIDKDYKTWSGNSFSINQSFFDKVQEFDTKNKIHIYKDSFYVKGLTPMECETRERNMLSKKMGKGWHIQLDVDEYVYDFKELKKYLKSYWYLLLFPKLTPITFKGKLITLFKQTKDGFLYIDNKENFAFITNFPVYHYARTNPNIKRFFTNFNVIHQSWARSEEQIIMKIKNWGHRDDFDTEEYVKYWRKLSEKNYKEANNFHPVSPKAWNKLYYLKAKNINEFIVQYRNERPQDLLRLSQKSMINALVKKIIR